MKIRAFTQIEYLRENFSNLSETCVPLWHPLGFVSCVIRDEPTYCTARIHYWPKDERRPKSPNWPIHTHAYDLFSMVMMGRVRDIQYREKSGSEYEVYAVSYAGDDSSIAPAGRTLSVELVVDQYHGKDEEYFVPIGSFHQTYVPLEESAITLVALSNFQHTKPLVLGHEARKKHPYARAPYNRELFWRRVGQVIGDLLGKT